MKKTMSCNTGKLISLVLANRADEAIAILEEGDFDKDILDDLFLFSEFGGADPEPFALPLYIITRANEIYFFHDGFKDFIMPVVKRNREGITKLLKYWKSKGYPVEDTVHFENYRELVAHFPYDGDDDWDYLLGGSLSQLVENGYDENEAKMCMALLTYDKHEIDHQIELGTNPDVWISGDIQSEDCNAYDGMNGLDTAYNSVMDAQICYGNWHYWESNPGYELEPVGYYQIRGLLGAAAYEQLIPTLERLARKDGNGKNY